MDHPAWSDILQQTWICRDPQVICRLLCTCKDMRSLIFKKCAGHLIVNFKSNSPPQERQFAQWLTGCGSVLLPDHLQVHMLGPSVEPLESEELAEETQFTAADATAASAAVLAQLPCANITNLTVTRHSWEDIAGNTDAMQGLAGLTTLQRLSIGSNTWISCAGPLFPALAGLTGLTSLKVNRLVSASKLRHLPQSLLELDLGIFSPGIVLTHLTNLTSFSGDSVSSLDSIDYLPPQLLHLNIGELKSVQRLIGLKKLHSLTAAVSTIPARRLERIAANLTQLTEVKLTYRYGVNEAAESWHLLPIRHLELYHDAAMADQPISQASLWHLAQLTQLTYFHIQRLDCMPATAEQLAEVLGRLVHLRALKLWASAPWLYKSCQAMEQHRQLIAQLPQQPQPEAPAAQLALEALTDANTEAHSGKVLVMKAVARLPHLTNLSLSLHNLGCVAAQELAAATQLTSLKLRACGVDNETLGALAHSLTGLRSLFAEYNKELDDAVLPVLHSLLPNLTELDIRYTSVTAEGKHYLETLQQLKSLQV